MGAIDCVRKLGWSRSLPNCRFHCINESPLMFAQVTSANSSFSTCNKRKHCKLGFIP